jgi:hypothetical protein
VFERVVERLQLLADGEEDELRKQAMLQEIAALQDKDRNLARKVLVTDQRSTLAK